MTYSIFTNYIYHGIDSHIMPEIFVRDEIYKNIADSHSDVSKFVNNVLGQYLDAFKPETRDVMDHYTKHGNGD